MAEKKTEAARASAAQESVYSVEEFAENAGKAFGARANADLVRAAFMVEGKTKATLSEAKDIVRKFMSREVK